MSRLSLNKFFIVWKSQYLAFPEVITREVRLQFHYVCSRVVKSASLKGKMYAGEYNEYYDFIIEVIHQAGQMVIEGFHNPKKVETKTSAADFVTDTDKNTEEFIIRNIKQKYPDHLIIGEESTPPGTSPTLTDAPTWIIDPVDGTTNFIHKIPILAISVALSMKKEVVVGVVFNPILNQFYSAVKGGGAYCNGKKITSTKNEDLHKSIVSNELSLALVPFLQERTLARVKKLSDFGVLGFRNFGSAALALCYVAEGSLDVYFTDGLQCWDVAAGILILQEAGGCASNPNGNEFDMFSRVLLTAGNQVLLKKMVEIISESDRMTTETVLKLMPESLKQKLSSGFF